MPWHGGQTLMGTTVLLIQHDNVKFLNHLPSATLSGWQIGRQNNYR